MPAFKKGSLQLDPFAIEDTKNLANIRIHVERVIGLLRQKYLILYNEQPISCVSKKYEEGLYYDAIVHTCCALINLNPSVIRYDYNCAIEAEDFT